ncbi:MAG: hypothetical protein QM813_00430 [Verrucomicrobiota bacterium]
MLTVTCILEFSDGSKTSGSVATITSEGFWPVEYRVAIHRPPELPTTIFPEQLECFSKLSPAKPRATAGMRKGVYDLYDR